MEMRNCPKCGTDNRNTLPLKYSWQDWSLKQCVRCRFVYLENPPTYVRLAAEHPWEKNRHDRRERMRVDFPITYSASRALGMLRRRLVKKRDRLERIINRWFQPGPVADIGCGDGANLERLPNRFEPVGIELSAQLAHRSRERLAHRNVPILNMSAVEGLRSIPDATLSGIIMCSFLEHEIQPLELLSEASRALDKNGCTVIKVPNYACLNRRVLGSRWCGFHFPGHVNYFTPASLREMVECAGFGVASFGWADHFFLSDNMWLVAHRQG